MISIKVKKINDSVDLPSYETSSSAGMDISCLLYTSDAADDS